MLPCSNRAAAHFELKLYKHAANDTIEARAKNASCLASFVIEGKCNLALGKADRAKEIWTVSGLANLAPCSDPCGQAGLSQFGDALLHQQLRQLLSGQPVHAPVQPADSPSSATESKSPSNSSSGGTASDSPAAATSTSSGGLAALLSKSAQVLGDTDRETALSRFQEYKRLPSAADDDIPRHLRERGGGGGRQQIMLGPAEEGTIGSIDEKQLVAAERMLRQAPSLKPEERILLGNILVNRGQVQYHAIHVVSA